MRGATITVFEERRTGLVPIGRGVAGEGGVVRIDPITPVENVGALRFFASAPGAIPTEVEIPVGVGR